MAATDALLDELARLHGIAGSYFDVEGQECLVSDLTKRRLLTAMGLDVSGGAAIQAALVAERARESGGLLARVSVARLGAEAVLTLGLPLAAGESWENAARRVFVRMRGEGGELLHLDLSRARLSSSPAASPEGGRARIEVPLTGVAMGEWEVEAFVAGGAPESATGTLFVAPPHCYLPPEIERGAKIFGFAAQLYSLPSLDKCGVGTIAAAGEVAAFLGKDHGCQLLGLSPLHATPNRDPHDFSPYCPDSREWRNVIFLDLTACPEVRNSPTAHAELDKPATRKELDALDRAPRVQYQRTHELKLRILRLAFGDFGRSEERSSTPRGIEYLRFVEAGGESLRRFSEFRALRGDSPEFHRFCQWLVEDQLSTTQQSLRQQGMLGFYQDLAVGSSGGGADAWGDPELFVRGAEIGAPPDAFQKNGQTWGVLPMDPVKLRERAYAPFLRLLRTSMRHAGALRLDHVMGLWRLWWVPSGAPATEGAYVQYPADDLLALVALESWRCQCLVIGEDLGTVSDGVRQRMEQERILGCRLLLFERGADGSFRQPHEYPPFAAASFGSHDLPTFAGWWRGRDVELRSRLGLYKSEEEARDAPAARGRDRQALTKVLAPSESGEAADALDTALTGLHTFLGNTSSVLALTSLEDALGTEEQRNLPGTLSEYPNWTGKLGFTLDTLRESPRLRASAAALGRARRPLRGAHPDVDTVK